jgi:hypothetical protein
VSVPSRALLADPVFQLNVTLWLVQALPPEAPVNAVLHRAGYELHAIGPPLAPPPSLRPALLRLIGNADAPRPDVVLACRDDPIMLVVECKAQGFGPEGTPARQALKLLAVATDVAGPLSLPGTPPRRGYVAYLTVAPEHRKLLPTLAALQALLRRASILPASTGTLGLEVRPDGVWLEAGQVDGWPPPAAAALAAAVRVLPLLPGDDDPRPFYLIPWDPGVEGGQDPTLASFGKALLGARVLNAAKAVIGRAEVPGPVVVKTAELLHDATFGVSDFWRDRDDYRLLLKGCQEFIVAALRPLAGTLALVVPPHAEFVQLTLASDASQADAISALQSAAPGQLEEHMGQLSLFEAP